MNWKRISKASYEEYIYIYIYIFPSRLSGWGWCHNTMEQFSRKANNKFEKKNQTKQKKANQKEEARN